jgi:integrase
LAIRQLRNRIGYDAALSEFVFHEYGQPISESKFKRVWARACKKAKLVGKLFHDYRRTAARNMLRAGIPQAVAMQITGHKTDSMFRRYSIVSVDDKRAALKKQFEFLKGTPASTNVAQFPNQNTEENTEAGR